MDKKNQLTKLVIKEAKKLKEFSTKQEKDLLTFQKLISDLTTHCIYGKMTGNCFSMRATELIKKCAERVYILPKSEFRDCELSGKPKKSRSGYRYGNYFSPIECFIGFRENSTNGNNKILVNFIKGKTNKLSFTKF